MATISQINNQDIYALSASYVETASYALTAETLLGSVTSASYAGSASKSFITNDTSTNATFYPIFTSAESGYRALTADSSTLTYNPSTNTLTTANFVGTASVASTVNTVRIGTGDTYYLTFVDSSNGGAGSPEQLYTSTAPGLQYSAAAGILTATGFVGSLTGTASFASTASSVNTLNQNVSINGNLTVTGTSSITYISQSTLNVATNLITVNTINPGTRFGGLASIDSGSSPQRSGSILFDSVNDQWIFIHQNTAGAITSSVFLQGPQTYNNVGNETNITTNRIPKSTNAEHLGDSNITDTGTLVTINSNTTITGSVNGNSTSVSVVSSTASLDLNTSNFFFLQLNNASTTHINPTNIKPGQTINIRIQQASGAAGAVSWPTTVKQPSGSIYVPTTALSAFDVVSLISFDTTNLYLSYVKRLI